MPDIIDLKQARAERDIETCDLDAELHVEWRGQGRSLTYTDYTCGDGEPDTRWLWEELRDLLDQHADELESCPKCAVLRIAAETLLNTLQAGTWNDPGGVEPDAWDCICDPNDAEDMEIGCPRCRLERAGLLPKLEDET